MSHPQNHLDKQPSSHFPDDKQLNREHHRLTHGTTSATVKRFLRFIGQLKRLLLTTPSSHPGNHLDRQPSHKSQFPKLKRHLMAANDQVGEHHRLIGGTTSTRNNSSGPLRFSSLAHQKLHLHDRALGPSGNPVGRPCFWHLHPTQNGISWPQLAASKPRLIICFLA